jgi:beta-glucosidase
MTDPTTLPYRNPTLSIEARINDLLPRMTLAEKIGQMTQVESGSISPEEVTDYFIGSVLSGGDGGPETNDAAHWAEFTSAYQRGARAARLGIPLLYGIDAVHGHAKVRGATVFPHNIGLGATRNPDLLRRIGRATAREIAATGIWWDFSPVFAVPHDIRWGRTYEAYGQDPAVVAELGTAFFQGLQGDNLADPQTALATPKHFVGDGGTSWGSPTFGRYALDQGDTRLPEDEFRAVHLAPYLSSIRGGALSIMVSFSSWNGVKLHAHHYLLTEVLKGELGFEGFLVSDWGGIDQIGGAYEANIVSAINAGVDMCMVPFEYKRFIAAMTAAIRDGRIPQARVDDAVRRILRAKFALGLFERPFPEAGWLADVGCDAHRQLAREAVQQSAVLLKNENAALPIPRNASMIYVAGQAADDLGLQCGGWTITWQGGGRRVTQGTTLLEGLLAAEGPDAQVVYSRDCQFPPGTADYGIVLIAENPYAEGLGDAADLTLGEEEVALIRKMRAHASRVVVVQYSGRPLIITHALPLADAWVAAWLPGSEGQGVADALLGAAAWTGKLPVDWPRSMDQVPRGASPEPPLFPLGFGLSA